MCIICFLEDKFQYRLRKSSQLKTDRFEHSLIEYKLLFLDNYINSKYKICDKHNTLNNNLIRDSISELDINKINDFFDDIYHCYLSWINSKPIKAMEAMLKLLDSFEYQKHSIKLPNLIYFRGRRDENFISHWDMFHIPYNKRYLISNQRYSLVGQPLLYLCTSPYCVIKELNSTNHVKISSFKFIDNENSYILFDNGNTFTDLIDEKENNDIIKQTNNLFKDNYTPKDYQNAFYKLIFSSCCSFEINNKHENSHFIEEYILPQVLSQILKEDNYSGIIYTSTKAFNDKLVNIDYNLFIKFYKNYCLFTNYNEEKSYDPTYVYDKDLYNKFNISTPIDWDTKFENYYCDIDASIEYINNRLFTIKELSDYDLTLIHDINESLIKYKDFINLLPNKNIELKFDNMLKSIELHSLFLRNILVSINEKYIFKEDFKCLKRK